MIKNNYTIFITPPKAGKTRHFFFSKKNLYILVFLLLLFIIGDYIAIVKYRESVKLKKENTTLKAEKEELGKVAKIVDEIENEESFVRNFLGLETSGSNMGGLGLGGTNLNFIDAPSRVPPDSGITHVSNKDCAQKRSLIKRALCLKRDLQELTDELLDRKGEWDTTPTIMPVKSNEYWISSAFGWRKNPFTGLREFHSSLDISAKRGTPIIAPADGTVISIGKGLHIGEFVKVRHNDKFNTLYGHLLQHDVKEGQKVKRGDLLGLMGNTGRSTGNHLHYEVRKDKVSVNPRNHILNLNSPDSVMAMR